MIVPIEKPDNPSECPAWALLLFRADIERAYSDDPLEKLKFGYLRQAKNNKKKAHLRIDHNELDGVNVKVKTPHLVMEKIPLEDGSFKYKILGVVTKKVEFEEPSRYMGYYNHDQFQPPMSDYELIDKEGADDLNFMDIQESARESQRDKEFWQKRHAFEEMKRLSQMT